MKLENIDKLAEELVRKTGAKEVTVNEYQEFVEVRFTMRQGSKLTKFVFEPFDLHSVESFYQSTIVTFRADRSDFLE